MAHIKINVASGGIEHGTMTLTQLVSAAFGAGSSGQVFTSNGGAADPSWTTGSAGAGTVTSVSIVTANGFSGSVATATSTPAITLTLATTGLVVTQHSAVITTDTPSAGAVTCDLSASDAHSVTLAASTLITLTNPASSKRQTAILYLIQSGAGSFTPTFTPTVHWGTAGTPVWSTTTGLRDIIVLDWDGTTYRGAVIGLGY